MQPIHPGSVRGGTSDDELAIMRLMSAQEQAITENDIDGYLATFEPSAIVVNPFGSLQGHDPIAEFFRHMQSVAAPGVRDVILNFVVTIEGNTASSVATTLVIRGLTPPPELVACTTAQSAYRKNDAGIWRLTRHEIRADASFSPEVGTTSQMIERLAARVAELETRLALLASAS